MRRRLLSGSPKNRREARLGHSPGRLATEVIESGSSISDSMVTSSGRTRSADFPRPLRAGLSGAGVRNRVQTLTSLPLDEAGWPDGGQPRC